MFSNDYLNDVVSTHHKVSVSFRSYMFSNIYLDYDNKRKVNVSVSFRSYMFSNFEHILQDTSFKVSVSFRSYMFSNNLLNNIKQRKVRTTVSVSFRSYMFSNCHKEKKMLANLLSFPSPFGVICSLIKFKITDYDKFLAFPSPFGVICSLIFFYGWILPNILTVSVSFRSYMFSNLMTSLVTS